MRRAVFLDRDGVLNRAVVRDGKPYPPAGLDEVEILPGVAPALARLKRAGFLLVVVSNQPDVARGTTSLEQVEAINSRLAESLPIDEFRLCCHDDKDECACRKPRPGLILEAAARHQVDLASSFMVGDRWRDVEAGRRAGCQTVFLDFGYQERQPEDCDIRAASLDEAAGLILERVALRVSREGPVMTPVSELNVKIFADGADKAGMLEMYAKPFIKGLTTNPTLMRKAGIADYRRFAKEVLEAIPDRPISFEVFADEFAEMERQAREIAGWGNNVYVKIPVTNTRCEPSTDLIRQLAAEGVKVNVTAVMSLAQVREVAAALNVAVPSYVSVFAGRIADTGRDPVPHMAAAVRILAANPKAELIWASPRELLNIFQADDIGCHVITVTNDILKKLSLVGRDLDQYSLDTVRMFYNDAAAAGFSL